MPTRSMRAAKGHNWLNGTPRSGAGKALSSRVSKHGDVRVLVKDGQVVDEIIPVQKIVRQKKPTSGGHDRDIKNITHKDMLGGYVKEPTLASLLGVVSQMDVTPLREEINQKRLQQIAKLAL